MTTIATIRRGILTAALFACAGAPVYAQTFTVTTTVDGGPGSLRDAITQANMVSGSTIELGTGLVYLLSLHVLPITSSVTINGNGSTVDGGQLDRVLDIEGNITVVIENLTITHGMAFGFLSLGGGIFIRNANVTLVNCTVTSNSTDVENGLPDDGGGIAAMGTFDPASGTAQLAQLTLTNTTVSGNAGLNGGGLVCVLCGLQTSNAAFAGNTSAAGAGAGVFLVGDDSTAAVTSSAFTGNLGATHGGGIATSAGASNVTVTRTRFTSNGGATGSGIFNNAATVTATNNWWGCTFGPGNSGPGCAATADSVAGVGATTPYLVLKSSVLPASINPLGMATLTGDLTMNSDGADVSAGGTIPDGTTETFSGTLGAFAQPTVPTTGGKASDAFTAGAVGGAGTLSVSVDNQTVSSTLQIAQPQMALDQTSLTFSATSNGSSFVSQTGTQMIHLTQSGVPGLVTWTATSNVPWLVVSPASGSGSATLNVSVQFAAGLAATQPGSITLAFIGSGNNPGPINATLNVVTLPQMALDQTSLTFNATSNGSSLVSQTGTQMVQLTQSGSGPVTWTATSNVPWLVVSPASGSGSATLNVSVQFAPGLAATQPGSITLAFTGSGNTPGPINASLNVVTLPQMALDQTSLTFNATSSGSSFVSQTGTQMVQLTQSGSGLVTWTATSNVPWLVVSPASGSGSATLNVSVQFAPGLAATQPGSITLAFTGSGNTPGPINASLNVVTLPQVSIDRSTLVFNATTNGSSFVPPTGTQTVQLTQTGAGPLTWTASSNAPWLVVSPASGSGSAALTVSVQFVPGLAATQNGSITLSFTGAGNTAGPISVTLNTVPLPTVSLDRTSLQFGATTNGAVFLSQTGTQAIRLTQSGAGAITWTAASTAPWLVVSPAAGSGSATLNVSVQFAAGLTETQGASINLAFTGTGNSAGPITVTLTTTHAPAAPFGAFDTPLDGSTGLAGSVPFTGWALDGVQVTGTAICRDAVTGESATPDGRCGGEARIFIGDATFVDGARPDVQAQFPTYPLSSRAGWGYLMLTNFLPNSGNGTYTIYAYASNASGNTTLLGTKTITCANSASVLPFGAIDTPAATETVSGTVYANYGWVLAPTPVFADPPDGGSVSVVVDGLIVGSPGAWGARPDLTALFSSAQYPGIGNAEGVYGLDTTALTNGLHTIAWSVTSNLGATVGVGSRYFTVANNAVMASARAADVMAGVTADDLDRLPVDQLLASGRRGFDLSAPLENYGVADPIVIQTEELDRVELNFGTAVDSRFNGYLRTPSGLGSLPVGSQLDPVTGIFVWQAGVGFVGTYDFVFIRSVSGQAVARRDVKIILNPMHSTRVGPQTVIDAPAARGSDGTPSVVSKDGFAVTGWAADFSSTVDSGVDVVHVWAYPVNGGGANDPIFVGPALVNGSRPDVGALYGARFGKTGYGLVVNTLPPGIYDIAVFAYSTVSQTFAPAQIVRVIVR